MAPPQRGEKKDRPAGRRGPVGRLQDPSNIKEGPRTYWLTWLVAEPTMMSPVLAPVRALVRTTWIMFTVMALDENPSPLRRCSLRMTYPTPGRLTRVLGATPDE